MGPSHNGPLQLGPQVPLLRVCARPFGFENDLASSMFDRASCSFSEAVRERRLISTAAFGAMMATSLSL